MDINYDEKGIELECEFHDFLVNKTMDLPKCCVEMVPHSGKRRSDPSFDVVMAFDYFYWFDVVATYNTSDGGYRLKTEQKNFRDKIKEVYGSCFYPGSKEWYGRGIPFLAFKLLTDKDWRWYVIELKEDLYFIDYTGDLRVNKKLVPLCIPLENSFSFVIVTYKSLSLFKDRKLFFNQDLRYNPAGIVLPSPKKRGRKKKKEVEVMTAEEERKFREFLTAHFSDSYPNRIPAYLRGKPLNRYLKRRYR